LGFVLGETMLGILGFGHGSMLDIPFLKLLFVVKGQFDEVV
jgi:hypothetical protein